MIIYIVAGERNCRKGAVSDNGGLWANVGQTSRNPEDRLTDDDYRKKAAGGKWLVLAQFDVGDSLTDYDVHKYLKSHPEIKYDYSNNTEEFLFVTDDGSGRRAKEIVGEFVEVNCIPMLQNKVIELQQVIEELQVSRIEAENKLKHYMETDDGKLKAECFSLLEKANEEYFLKLEELDAERQKVKDILKLRQSQLDVEEQKALNHRKDLDKRGNLILQAEARQKQTEAKLREREFFLEEQHNKRETKINYGAMGVTAFITFVAVSCGSGVMKENSKALKNQVDRANIQLSNKDKDMAQLAQRVKMSNESLAEKDKYISDLQKNLVTCNSAKEEAENKPVKVQTVKQVVHVPKIVEKVKMVQVPAPIPVPQPQKIQPVSSSGEYASCTDSCKVEKRQCYSIVTDGGVYKGRNGKLHLSQQYECDNRVRECSKNCKVLYGDD